MINNPKITVAVISTLLAAAIYSSAVSPVYAEMACSTTDKQHYWCLQRSEEARKAGEAGTLYDCTKNAAGNLNCTAVRVSPIPIEEALKKAVIEAETRAAKGEKR